MNQTLDQNRLDRSRKTGAKAKNLNEEWAKILEGEFDKPYMQQLRAFLIKQRQDGKIIFPQNKDIFSSLNLTPFSKVKVVVIGQDPYHGENQAHGLSFSVQPGVPIPPSLLNIYKELKYDLNITQPKHGFLEYWASQGALLLNAVLTVEKSKAASHQKQGWETFTDKIIEVLNEKREHLVFLLWGAYAQKKGSRIDRSKHLVVESPHPSPLSAHRGFLGSRPFSQTNRYLISKNIEPIDWQLQELHQEKNLPS